MIAHLIPSRIGHGTDRWKKITMTSTENNKRARRLVAAAAQRGQTMKYTEALRQVQDPGTPGADKALEHRRALSEARREGRIVFEIDPKAVPRGSSVPADGVLRRLPLGNVSLDVMGNVLIAGSPLTGGTLACQTLASEAASLGWDVTAICRFPSDYSSLAGRHSVSMDIFSLVPEDLRGTAGRPRMVVIDSIDYHLVGHDGNVLPIERYGLWGFRLQELMHDCHTAVVVRSMRPLVCLSAGILGSFGTRALMGRSDSRTRHIVLGDEREAPVPETADASPAGRFRDNLGAIIPFAL